MNNSLKSAPALRILLLTLTLIPTTSAFSQQPAPDPSPVPQATNTQPRVCKGNFFKNILCDQKAIWTSPAELERDDARWLVPLGLTTAGLMALAMFRKVAASTGPLSGALFMGGAAMVCADEAGVKSRREAMTIPTASDATMIRSE